MFYSKMSPPSSGLLWQKTKTVFTVALVHWAGLQHRKQQSSKVRCDLVTLPAGPLERKETDCVTVLVYVVSVITPVVVYCGGWAGEGLACPCLWRAAIILSTRHSPGSWRDQWGQQQSVSNCAIKWVPAVHLIRVLTELQEAGGRAEGTVSCGSFQNCLFQHFCCWEFYKGRVNVFISWWNICPAQGPPAPLSSPLQSRPKSPANIWKVVSVWREATRSGRRAVAVTRTSHSSHVALQWAGLGLCCPLCLSADIKIH